MIQLAKLPNGVRGSFEGKIFRPSQNQGVMSSLKDNTGRPIRLRETSRELASTKLKEKERAMLYLFNEFRSIVQANLNSFPDSDVEFKASASTYGTEAMELKIIVGGECLISISASDPVTVENENEPYVCRDASLVQAALVKAFVRVANLKNVSIAFDQDIKVQG